MLPPSLSEVTGPLFGYDSIKPTTSTSPGSTPASRSASASSCSGRVLDANARPVANTLVEIWQANSAGRYPHKRDQHDAPTDPNFTGARANADRRRGPLPLRVDPTRRVPLAQPLQRMAAGAHPFLAVRPGIRDAARDADVFPGRSAARLRSDVHQHPGRTRAQAPRLELRLGDDDSRRRRSATGSTSSCAAATKPRWKTICAAGVRRTR